jgi:hypothetical protein
MKLASSANSSFVALESPVAIRFGRGASGQRHSPGPAGPACRKRGRQQQLPHRQFAACFQVYSSDPRSRGMPTLFGKTRAWTNCLERGTACSARLTFGESIRRAFAAGHSHWVATWEASSAPPVFTAPRGRRCTSGRRSHRRAHDTTRLHSAGLQSADALFFSETIRRHSPRLRGENRTCVNFGW